MEQLKLLGRFSNSKMSETPTLAVVRLSAGREKMILNYHPWVFSGALDQSSGKAAAPPAGTVRLEDHQGSFLAWAQHNPQSKIRLRIYSLLQDQFPNRDWLKSQVATAWRLRQQVCASTNAYRLVFAESDGIPGLVIDCFGDYLLLQVETAGAQTLVEELIACLVELSQEFLPSLKGIIESSDSDGRSLEGLSPRYQLHWGRQADADLQINEYKIPLGLRLGQQKTGFYTDQRENRHFVASFARGKSVLDACCYSGGFAAHALGAGASQLTLLDSSLAAIELAKTNLALQTSLDHVKRDFIVSDVFSGLRSLVTQGSSFGLVVLDPPKLAPNKDSLPRALRAYKDLNLHAIKLVEPGGYLATFSCSGAVKDDDLRQVIAFAAKDAGRRTQVLAKLQQGPDHPSPLGFAESSYLKGFLVRIL